ncbi:MAG: hypothetical protein A3C44_04120 [Gammaproteobacteria bacterium RIFCSPHIGHO2_02_FULL_39_13]|nr:MAG: hypothetical protein A3C44_04120 [Gammaproteobacteria bacterium RIFCSPHIGHO2_02_FULL_39_13]OGT48262.1 MAG: hypothetical protein A3E53_07865 [Gammaproteobacteria bacterium RIFCSPHIGHO2_12_FULL_39_24]
MLPTRGEQEDNSFALLNPRDCADKAHSVVGFLRDTFVSAALMGIWTHEAIEVENFGLNADEIIKKAWIGFVIFAVSAVSNLALSVTHYRHRFHLAPLFSSSYVFIALDLFSPTGAFDRLPLQYFLLLTTISMGFVLYLVYKFKRSESGNHLITTFDALENLALPRFPNASTLIRVSDGLYSAGIAGSAMLAVSLTVTRELAEHTGPLDLWLKELLGLLLIPAFKMGYELTRHPKCFYVYLAMVRLSKECALIYRALSGLFSLLAVYVWCSDQQMCLNYAARLFLSHVSFFVALALASHAAATTDYDFKDSYEKNCAMETTIKNIPSNFRLCIKSAGGFFSSGFRYLQQKLLGCYDNNDSKQSPLVTTS